MKILIANPNGHVGRKLIPELLGPEFSARVIARDTSCLPRHILERVQVVRGSTDDFATRGRGGGRSSQMKHIGGGRPDVTKIQGLGG
jgi:hypothetical protein